MLTPAQIEQRRTLITATDASAICAVNPWRTVHDVFAEKTMGIVNPETYRMRRGNALERLGLELAAEHFGVEVRPNAETSVHAILTWLGATADGLATTGGKLCAVAEVKCVGPRVSQHWDDDAGEPIVPDYVATQAQIQMTVKRVKLAYVVAMLDVEDEPRFYAVEHEPDLETAILESCDRFRRVHLEPRVPPSLDGSESAYQMVRSIFPRPRRAELLPASQDMSELAVNYLAAQRAEAEAKAAKQAVAAQMCAAIGEHEGMYGPGWRALWKYREATRVEAYERAGYRSFDLCEVKAKERAA